MENLENQIQNLDDTQQVEKRCKNTSKYVNPIVAWSLIFITFATAILTAILVIAPLANG